MKEKFRQWLISQNSEFINECGIDCILSKIEERLFIINANEQEAETLCEWLEQFYSSQLHFPNQSNNE